MVGQQRIPVSAAFSPLGAHQQRNTCRKEKKIGNPFPDSGKMPALPQFSPGTAGILMDSIK